MNPGDVLDAIIQQLHWCCTLVIFCEISINSIGYGFRTNSVLPLHRNLNIVGVALFEPFSLSCLTKTLVNRTFKAALVKICMCQMALLHYNV